MKGNEDLMRKVKAADLILDFDLYPRNSIDSHNVNSLIDALASEGELPPVVIDKRSRRVVDGFHRVKAHIAFFGEDKAEIMVAEKQYRNEREMFLDAMRYNASHGAKLDSCDRTHCLLVAERLKIPTEDVAGALHIAVDKLAALRVDRTARSGALTIPLKRTIQWKAGTALTKEQVSANTRLSGMNQQFYVNQLITLLETDLLDTSDEILMTRLQTLSNLLKKTLVKYRSSQIPA